MFFFNYFYDFRIDRIGKNQNVEMVQDTEQNVNYKFINTIILHCILFLYTPSLIMFCST